MVVHESVRDSDDHQVDLNPYYSGERSLEDQHQLDDGKINSVLYQNQTKL